MQQWQIASAHEQEALVIMTDFLVRFRSENQTKSPGSSPEKKLATKIAKKDSFGAILAMKKATVDSRLLCPTVFLIINRSF